MKKGPNQPGLIFSTLHISFVQFSYLIYYSFWDTHYIRPQFFIFVTHLRDPILQLPLATPIRDSSLRPPFTTCCFATPSCDPTTDRRTVSTPQRHLPSVPTLTLKKFWNLVYCLAFTSSYCPPPCPPPLVALCLLTLPLAHPLLQRPLPPPPPPARPPDNIPTFITPSTPPSIPPVWEHVIAVLLKLPPTTAEGQNLRSWVTYHSLTSLEDFLVWELDTLQYDAITVCFPSRDTTQPNSLVSLKPNSIRHLIMLKKYIHHLVQDSYLSVSSDATDHALEPDNFLHTTFHQFMSWKLNEITTSSPSPPPSVTASDPRAAPSTSSHSSQLLNFKRDIKRDISAYPTPKDEKYYESFKRSV